MTGKGPTERGLRLTSVLTGCALLFGCATEPAEVRTTLVSPDLFQAYMGLDCQAVHREFEIVRSRLSASGTASSRE